MLGVDGISKATMAWHYLLFRHVYKYIYIYISTIIVLYIYIHILYVSCTDDLGPVA